jgi:hypothetical protein
LAQLFSSYILALAKGFWQKKALLYDKCPRKLLMKLTTGGNPKEIWSRKIMNFS